MGFKPEAITCENLILCEGMDECLFFCWYLQSEEKKADDQRLSENIQILDFGGNEQLEAFLNIIKNTPGYELVKNLIIIRDAEKDAGKAVRDIQKALSAAGFSTPDSPCKWTDGGEPSTAFLILPSLKSEPIDGTLEHLCMKIIKEEYSPKVVIGAVSSAMDKLKEEGIREFPHDFKSKIHGFFSMTDKFVGNKIGEAARIGAFDWNSEELAEFRNLLIDGMDRIQMM